MKIQFSVSNLKLKIFFLKKKKRKAVLTFLSLSFSCACLVLLKRPTLYRLPVLFTINYFQLHNPGPWQKVKLVLSTIWKRWMMFIQGSS